MTKIKSLALCAVASMVILGTTTANAAFKNAATNLLTNGDFEDVDISLPSGYRGESTDWDYFDASDVGWNGSNVEIWKSRHNNVDSYDGGQHAELNSRGQDAPFSIYQTFNTVAGQRYQFDFAYRSRLWNAEWFKAGVRDGTPTPSGEIFSHLSLFEQLIFSKKMGPDTSKHHWSTFTRTFVARSDLTTIFFHTDYSGLAGNLIDGVSVVTKTTAVPVPAAVWLFGSAFAGLIGFGRRKTK